MTYILGAKCRDGIVLVGDTKVTTESGFAYSKKLNIPFHNVVMGSAGVGGLYKDFQNRIISAIRMMNLEGEKTGYYITTDEEFSVLITNVIREMHNTYGEDRHLWRPFGSWILEHRF